MAASSFIHNKLAIPSGTKILSSAKKESGFDELIDIWSKKAVRKAAKTKTLKENETGVNEFKNNPVIKARVRIKKKPPQVFPGNVSLATKTGPKGVNTSPTIKSERDSTAISFGKNQKRIKALNKKRV